MSDEESFVTRWSRLKRESAEDKKCPAKAETLEPLSRSANANQTPGAGNRPPQPEPRAVPTAVELFDPSTLPPIDSIAPGSDIRVFLQKGVPAELMKAALRRAWTTDPAIRDFIGIAENQWDFTDPTAIPGFGLLERSSDFSQCVAQAMGKLPDGPAAAGLSNDDQTAIASAETTDFSPVSAGETPDSEDSDAIAALHQAEPAAGIDPASGRKRHGGALPR
jgi:hypothetical protein